MMKKPRAIADVCNTIVSADKTQRVVLLHFIDLKKYRVIKEVAVNILLNKHIALSESEKRYLRRKTPILKNLALKQQNLTDIRAFLVKHQMLIKRICRIVLKHLAIKTL